MSESMKTRNESWEFGPQDVECPACGKLDNHARHRRGLCCWCYCSLSNAVGEQAVQEMPADELMRRAKAVRLAAIRRGTAPKIKTKEEIAKESAAAELAREKAAKERIKAANRAYLEMLHKRDAAKAAAKVSDGTGALTPEEAAELKARKEERRRLLEKESRRRYRTRHKEQIAAYQRVWRQRKKA